VRRPGELVEMKAALMKARGPGRRVSLKEPFYRLREQLQCMVVELAFTLNDVCKLDFDNQKSTKRVVPSSRHMQIWYDRNGAQQKNQAEVGECTCAGASTNGAFRAHQQSTTLCRLDPTETTQ
jgi:hypothetical protein